MTTAATTETYDPTITARIERAADGGSWSALEILGARYALPILRRKYELVMRRINTTAAGRVPSNTDAEYANIIGRQIGQLNAQMSTHPDAAYFAEQNAYAAFRAKGLRGLLDVITTYGQRARELAFVPERGAELATQYRTAA